MRLCARVHVSDVRNKNLRLLPWLFARQRDILAPPASCYWRILWPPIGHCPSFVDPSDDPSRPWLPHWCSGIPPEGKHGELRLTREHQLPAGYFICLLQEFRLLSSNTFPSQSTTHNRILLPPLNHPIVSSSNTANMVKAGTSFIVTPHCCGLRQAIHGRSG